MTSIDPADLETYDAAWFGEHIGKTADWVTRHLYEIPHTRVGRTPRFTAQDLRDYLTAGRVVPMRMATVTRGRRAI